MSPLQKLVFGLMLCCSINSSCLQGNENHQHTALEDTIFLPSPVYQGEISVEQCLYSRRSHRQYSDKTTSLDKLSQLLWAAQGISDNQSGFRTSPSAGALFPFTVYLQVMDVHKLSPGIYSYYPDGHFIKLIEPGNFKDDIANAALGQNWIKQANLIIFLAADFNITTAVYGSRGERYVWMEAGHIAQNIYLQSTSLNLGSVAVGAYRDQQINEILNLPENLTCVYIMVVGELLP